MSQEWSRRGWFRLKLKGKSMSLFKGGGSTLTPTYIQTLEIHFKLIWASHLKLVAFNLEDSSTKTSKENPIKIREYDKPGVRSEVSAVLMLTSKLECDTEHIALQVYCRKAHFWELIEIQFLDSWHHVRLKRSLTDVWMFILSSPDPPWNAFCFWAHSHLGAKENTWSKCWAEDWELGSVYLTNTESSSRFVVMMFDCLMLNARARLSGV